MFFKPNINEDVFPVLEVGPGALPFKYSDLWLDFLFDEKERLAQSGNSKPAIGRPLIFYKGGKFPFKDKAFPYVVASHVLEHIPWDEIPLFLSELERVALAGYIELPRWTYELINDVPEHMSTGDVRDGVLHIYKKNSSHRYNFFTSELLEKSANFRSYVEAEKDLFFCRLEWHGKIPVDLHEAGYAISFGQAGIVSELGRDCDRLLTPNFLQPRHLEQSFKSRVTRLPGVRRLFSRKLDSHPRRTIDSGGVLSRLQCPQCDHSLNAEFQCVHCQFSFDIRGKEYHPMYSDR